MAEEECRICLDQFPEGMTNAGRVCWVCSGKQEFADFAKSCGLQRFPDPTGEHYVFKLDCSCCGKKGENVDLIDQLWNALVQSKGGSKALLIDREE
jgi:hypothetical protein